MVTGHLHESRLRVAYIVGEFPNLSETFVVNQIVGVAARGHDVDIYTTSGGQTPVVSEQVARYGLTARTQSLSAPAGWRGITAIMRLLVAVGLRTPRILARTFAVALRNRFIGARRLLYVSLTLIDRNVQPYDVIHAQFGPFGVFAEQLVGIGALRGTIVTSFRGYDLGKYLRAYPNAYAGLFKRGKLFLPVSRTLAKRLIDAGCKRDKVRVHHSGVSCRRLRFRESCLAGDLKIITIARLVEKKGILDALRAVAQLLREGQRVSYTVVGDGPQRDELERLARSLGVATHVHFVGALSHENALEMLYHAHVLLAPSVTAADGDEEGIPNAIKEAMAMGLPVVATVHGGIAELVEDGVSGFLVPERNPPELARRLAYLISHQELWTALGRAGRRRIEAEYDIERLNEDLITLYREATGRDVPSLAGREADNVLYLMSADSARRL